jgi:hypothetical protein
MPPIASARLAAPAQEYSMSIERRQHTRLSYTPENPPVLRIGTVNYGIRDLSEGGVVFVCYRQNLYPVNALISGAIIFNDGVTIPIEGRVLRHADGVIVVAFTQEAQSAAAFRERRRFFRLRYPRGEEVGMKWAGTPYVVIEISEEGVVVRRHAMDNWVENEEVRADVFFHDRTVVQVVGHVLRLTESEVVLHLTDGIPARTVFDEQRYLIRKSVDLRRQ